MLLKKRIPFSYIFKEIRFEILYVFAIGIVVFYLTLWFKKEIPVMPLSIPAFMGTALSVLLSFKISQSYDRWWEARKIWGAIVNDSRSFVLQLQSFLPAGNDEDIRLMTYRHMAWCYSLGQTLRETNPLDNLNKFLPTADLKQIEAHKNKHLAILQLNTLHIATLRNNGQLDAYSHVQINNTMVNFSNAMGMAERIKSTVFPVTYRYFLHLIIYLFVITLSIALDDIQIYFEIPLLLIISSAFFLLEKTATRLQDPFSNSPTDTAMTAIATTIEINLRQLIGETALPEPHKPESFYLM